MILQIIFNTPVYVWFLFLFLLWSGWRRRKDEMVSWKEVFFFPVALFGWSLYATLSLGTVPGLLLGIGSLAIGARVGFKMGKKETPLFDKESGKIGRRGSLLPLFVSLSIFAIQYFLAVADEMGILVKGRFILESLPAAFSGLLVGRLFGCWRQMKKLVAS